MSCIIVVGYNTVCGYVWKCFRFAPDFGNNGKALHLGTVNHLMIRYFLKSASSVLGKLAE